MIRCAGSLLSVDEGCLFLIAELHLSQLAYRGGILRSELASGTDVSVLRIEF